MFKATTHGVNLQQVLAEAAKEINEEKVAKAKVRIKDKLKQLEAAKAVVANIEREYADLVQQIADGN